MYSLAQKRNNFLFGFTKQKGSMAYKKNKYLYQLPDDQKETADLLLTEAFICGKIGA